MTEFSARLSNIPLSTNAKKKPLFTSPLSAMLIAGLFMIEILQLMARM